MKLGYELTIEQSQKLVMTPELIQAIQILQFNTQELETYVQEQLLANPVLENEAAGENPGGEAGDGGSASEKDGGLSGDASGREIDWQEYIKENDGRDYDDISYRQWEYNKKETSEFTYEQYTSEEVTLAEHLMFQLQFAPIKKSCRPIGKYIIESLDENGYMTLTVDEIVRAMEVSRERVEIVLDAIQNFEPAGIAARDLRECLLIQLRLSERSHPHAEAIVRNHLEDMAENRILNIARELGISPREVQEACDLIRSLEPKPGRQFASQASATRYIVPDATVEEADGEFAVTVNESSVPRLSVSGYYRKLLEQADQDEALYKFLSGRFHSAVWLIRSIEQRKQTIYNVVRAIVKFQEGFFRAGPKYLKPLTLKQVAEEVGIHESTVSRSIHGKYLQCPRGVFEFKYFFSGGVVDEQGEGVSSSSIKTFLREIIAAEDPRAPRSDQYMAGVLEQKGILISRRTVAKYRDELGIPSSSRRKRY